MNTLSTFFAKFWKISKRGEVVGLLVNRPNIGFIERDYEELKQELGLGHYEGRGWRGFSSCHVMHRRLRLPGSGKKPFFPSARAGQLWLRAPEIPPEFQPRGVFVPSERSEHKDTQPLRYIAIRLRQRQGGLFADGSTVRHFAVLSNLWDWDPVRLIQWHREKAGTIERVHDVMKSDLAAGVLSSKYFGANGAWLRLAVISYNVLTALKCLALPAELLSARPKRLRFLIFHTAGRLVHRAGQLRLRLAMEIEEIAGYLAAVRLLPLPI
jgi:hypothetical protein